MIWTIARRELKALFDHPTGYILLVIFVAINDFLFFRGVFTEGAATIRPMLGMLPWLFLFFVPAVAMRALAEDTRTGAIEVVLAQPVTELELLIGKYLGQLLMVLIGLALTLPIPLALSFGGSFSIGQLFAQYVGAALLAAGFTGVGVWASSLTRNQVTAFIIAVAVSFVLILIGLDPMMTGLPPAAAMVAARLGVLSHFTDIGRGVIDLRDVLYFLTLAGIFLGLAYGRLMGRKLSVARAARKRLRMGVAVIVAAMVVLDLVGGYIGGRLDLTPGHAYTLSHATKNILGHLDDLVTIRLFASKDLPPQIALLRRDVSDLLSDYRSAGHGNVRIVVQDPSSKDDIAQQARQLGVQPVQFNVVGRSQASVQEGWFGLAVRYEDHTGAIPLIRKTDDLEYRLTSMIHGFANPSHKTVGLAIEAQRGGMGGPASYSTLRQQLSRNYTVKDVNLAGGMQPDSTIDVLIVAGQPDSLSAAARARLEAYFRRGGAALIMARGMNLNPQYQMAQSGRLIWNAVLHPYGVGVRPNLVDDLMSNETVGMRSALGEMITPYPLWVEGVSTRSTPVNEEIASVFLPWVSSIDTTGARPGTVVPLVTSSRAAGARSGFVSLSPQQQFPRDSLKRRVLAVLLKPTTATPGDPATAGPGAKATGAANGATAASKTAAAAPPHGPIILVGDDDFVSDHFAANAPQNLGFALNAVDWLAQDPTLMAIRSKSRMPPPLVFSSDTTRDIARYANLIGVPLLIILFGVARLLKRRRVQRQHYAPAATGGAA